MRSSSLCSSRKPSIINIVSVWPVYLTMAALFVSTVLQRGFHGSTVILGFLVLISIHGCGSNSHAFSNLSKGIQETTSRLDIEGTEDSTPNHSITRDNLYQDIKSATASSTRKYVVVFDIGHCLCLTSRLEREQVMQHFPECPVINWNETYYRNDGQPICDKYVHIFLPHLQILFEYLLGKGARIVFFSGGRKERNDAIVPELLKSYWGAKKYEILKSEGQFTTFSKNDLVERDVCDSSNKQCRKSVKDLDKVIRNGESISDIILIDNNSSYAIQDQRPLIVVADAYSLGEAMNNIYYIFGLFKTYFENEEYNKLPLRGGINKMLFEHTFNKNDTYFEEEHPFSIQMINIGLLEVRKLVPEARLYMKADQFHEF